MPNMPRALVLTVGTGTTDQLEESLLTPLRKSIEKGQWTKVVLLPSKQTSQTAFALRDSNPKYPIEVRALRHAGDEEDADACFEHFERELARLHEADFPPHSVTVDFTRGTKAMSAALVLAAVVHGVPTLRYITSGRRDDRGVVVPGTEVPHDFPTARVTVRRDLDRAQQLLRAGQFAACERTCAIPPAGPLGSDVRWAKWAAQFWGAWDRFDYVAAAALHDSLNLRNRPGWMTEYSPPAAMLTLLKSLANRLPGEPAKRVAPCRDLAADILGNARRRLAEGQTEEVLVRAYRVVELIGQYRLFSHALDPADLKPPQEWLARQEASGSPVRPNFDGKLQIGREAGASLLAFLKDPLAARLSNLDWLGELSVNARNKSVLIHGFTARTRGKKAQIGELLSKVEQFFVEENSRNNSRLLSAGFPFLST
jgi:CRISPR-associated protein (TIGR02710 family)